MENTDLKRVTTYVPPELKRQLEESAKVNRRSLANEVFVRLEQSADKAAQRRQS